jgi:gamma-D-glutamyl-L-lysine dipeptidyl-peptidase
MLVFLMLAMSANGVVSRPVANIYSGPDEDRDVVSQAIFATNVVVLEEQDGWARVRTPDDYAGWIRAGDLLKAPEYAIKGRVAQVESLFANLYRETDITKHEPVLTLPYESRLEVAAEPELEGRRWVQVRLPDDRAAWVQRGDLTFEPKKLSLAEAMEFANRFVGITYRWGGVSTFGYDCSGFMQMVFRRQGMLLPRDAGPQMRWSGFVAVGLDELQPGDLVYFGPSDKKITHTGMYVGGGRFINSTAYRRPGVQISELADPHWKELLVASRRLK